MISPRSENQRVAGVGQWGATGLQAKGHGENRRLQESGSGTQKGPGLRAEKARETQTSAGLGSG